MEVSMAHDEPPSPEADLPAWKHWGGWAAAALLALLFLVAGFWKLSDPMATEARMIQALVPAQFALAAALAAGIAEVWSGVLVIVPRWRKWGAWLCALMLVVFMVYFAAFYNRLQGDDCSCFPWLKRVVGPGFFLSDAGMLLLAILAGLWSQRSRNWKQALVALGAIVVFAGAVYGVTAARLTGIRAPAQITVDGKTFPMMQERVFLFFFDPECMHCYDAAERMSKYAWKNVKVVAIPTVNPKWAAGFLRDTGLKAGVSTETARLRQVFSFSTDPPYGVALERGYQKQSFINFDKDEPLAELRKMGWVQ